MIRRLPAQGSSFGLRQLTYEPHCHLWESAVCKLAVGDMGAGSKHCCTSGADPSQEAIFFRHSAASNRTVVTHIATIVSPRDARERWSFATTSCLYVPFTEPRATNQNSGSLRATQRD
jgi:hypothetical protein